MGSSLQTYNKKEKLALWAQRVQECRASGMSAVKWCEENGISKYTYYEWQRKVYNAWNTQNEEQAVVDVTPHFSGSSAVATIYRNNLQIDVYDSSLVLEVLGRC